MQPLQMDICQIGYFVCEFMTVEGAKKWIEYVSIMEVDYLYRWAILERGPTHVYQQPTQQVTDMFLTVPSSLTSEMI